MPASITNALWAACTKRDGTLYANLGARLRAALGDGAPVVPFGDGDAKTASPGTYRPVGTTCPATCPYLGSGCYAQSGNVVLHQRRARVEREAAVNGANVAMVWAVRTGRLARLHVSGDFGSSVDMAYVDAVCDVADAVNVKAGRPVGTSIAWTYTHHAVTYDTPWIAKLRAHGVHVRISDSTGKGGAIVASFADVPQLRRETGARIAKCPAQLTDTTCAKCGLCWTRPDVVIAFDPHGGSARRAAEVSPMSNQSRIVAK